jgi:hypothetical protein
MLLAAIFAMLLIMGLVALFASYALLGGFIQILLIIALVVLGVSLIQGRRFF